MMNIRTTLAAIVAAVAVLGSWGCVGHERQGTQQRLLATEKANRIAAADTSFSVFVDPGTAASATEYYKRIQSLIELPLLDASDQPAATLDQLLQHFGYTGLAASDLETLSSSALMPKAAADLAGLAELVADRTAFEANLNLQTFANDNVLVSRFFAPKIVDYSKSPLVPGWRKLVKLKALPGSAAQKANLADAYILFNFVRADLTTDPFCGNESKNNQVIITPATPVASGSDSLLFMVFEKKPGYRLGLALEGVAFDLPARNIAKYFVPGSCAQCHGHDDKSGPDSPKPANGIFRTARLNYLDTDQWHDMVGYDFQDVDTSDYGVVFDGGKTPGTTRHKNAFDVIRRLNTAIREQNSTVQTGDFKIAAADKWLELHTASDAPVPMAERVLSLGKTWDANDPDQMQLLQRLNRYCFRCHSSVRYNVFDKQSTSESADLMPGRLRLATDNERYMPNGRELTVTERDELIGLIIKVFPDAGP